MAIFYGLLKQIMFVVRSGNGAAMKVKTIQKKFHDWHAEITVQN